MQNPEEQRYVVRDPSRSRGAGDVEADDVDDLATVSGQRSNMTDFSVSKQLKILEGTDYIEPKLYQ